MLPSYIRVRAVVWAYGSGQTDRQTDTQTRVTTIHFASSIRLTQNVTREQQKAWLPLDRHQKTAARSDLFLDTSDKALRDMFSFTYHQTQIYTQS